MTRLLPRPDEVARWLIGPISSWGKFAVGAGDLVGRCWDVDHLARLGRPPRQRICGLPARLAQQGPPRGRQPTGDKQPAWPVVLPVAEAAGILRPTEGPVKSLGVV